MECPTKVAQIKMVLLASLHLKPKGLGAPTTAGDPV
jgi:hypothetical protein